MNDKPQISMWKYAGLATQFLIGIGLALFAGLKLDAWLKFSMPVGVWVLPLLLIIAVIIGIVRDTSRKK
jgi:uncharacterized membrane protein YhiD involved in acid resistance